MALALLGALGAYLVVSRGATYRAEATVRVQLPSSALGSPGEQPARQLLTSLLARAAASTPVLSVAGDQVGSPVHATAEAVVAGAGQRAVDRIVIAATDTDPLTAQAAANAVAGTLVAGADDVPYVAAVVGDVDLSGVLSVVGSAALPTTPRTTDLGRNLLLGAGTAVVIGAAAILLLELVGLVAEAPAELERDLDLAVLGIIPSSPSARPVEAVRAPLVSARGRRGRRRRSGDPDPLARSGR